MPSALDDPSWNAPVIGSGVKQHTNSLDNFLPLVVHGVHQLLLPQILAPDEVVPWGDAAPVFFVTAEAAGLFPREVQIELALHNKAGAGGDHLWHHSATEDVKASVSPVDPTSTVFGIIVHLPIDCVVMVQLV